MFSVEFRYRARKIYKSVKQIVELVSNVLLFLASFLAIILVIYRFGFDMPADYSHEIYYTYRAIIRLFVVLGLLRFLFNFANDKSPQPMCSPNIAATQISGFHVLPSGSKCSGQLL